MFSEEQIICAETVDELTRDGRVLPGSPTDGLDFVRECFLGNFDRFRGLRRIGRVGHEDCLQTRLRKEVLIAGTVNVLAELWR